MPLSIRSLIRDTGLSRRLSPWIDRFEAWNLSRYGFFRVEKINESQARLYYGDGQTRVVGPPAKFAEMACSRHELPTLVALLNIFSQFADGAVAWDVGANAGFYTALLGELVGDSGKVYGFEPVPDTCSSMLTNLNAAGCTNAILIKAAISDRDGVLPISVDPANDKVSSLEARAGTLKIDVRVARGDGIVEAGECEAPAVIKIDVEGHELKALQGMRATLARLECRAVLCEIHFSILAAAGEHSAAAKARKILREAGFNNCRFLSRSHLLALKVGQPH